MYELWDFFLAKYIFQLNHHGNVTKAMGIIQFSSDVILEYNLDLFYMNVFKDWDMPVHHLYNIYKEYYGQEVITEPELVHCTTWLLLKSLEISYGAGEAFSEVAKLNPFLVYELPDYFSGGLDDVAKKTTRVWNTLVRMLETGTSNCAFPDNPLDISCKEIPHPVYRHRNPMAGSLGREWNGALNFSPKDVLLTRKGLSIHLTPSKRFLRKFATKNPKKRAMYKDTKENLKPSGQSIDDNRFFDGTYYINSSYARLGWSQTVCDVNNDGHDDVILGAPGYSTPNNIQQGAVVFVYGTDTGMPWLFDVPIDLTNLTLRYSDILTGPSTMESQFGSSVTCLDVNQDGVLDLVVGAPGFGNSDVDDHNGRVYIYYGRQNASSFVQPNITITCQSKFCNLGYSLTSVDLNKDDHDDLVMGSPYYSATGTQQGAIGILYSDKSLPGRDVIEFETLQMITNVKQNFSWFGHRIKGKEGVLIISQPYYRKCARGDCQFSVDDKQGVGSLTLINTKNTTSFQNLSLSGKDEFDMIGFCSDFGRPYGDDSLILAISAPGDTVPGVAATLPVLITQAGSVILFNISSAGDISEMATFYGDTRYSQFGSFIQFDDINGDGVDDFLIGAPMRSDDWTEIGPRQFVTSEDGKLYAFYGGETFPRGNGTVSSYCGVLTPCPGHVSNITFFPLEGKGAFGYSASVVKAPNVTSVLVTAVRADERYTYGEFGLDMNGRIYDYQIPHPP
ncbi:phosphatidylinositol-glycan-specific phospholipase D-like [Crassostrea virginica]